MADFVDMSGYGLHRDGTQEGTPVNPAVVEHLQDMYKMCLAMESLKDAAPTLYLMEKCLRKNMVMDPGLLRLPELVEEHFRKMNEPQPSIKNEGCNFILGSPTQIGNMIGQNGLEQAIYSDDQVARALCACVGKGKVIDNKQKWAGAYWGLRWYCKYPTDPEAFCDRIKGLHIPQPKDMECCYENIRKFCKLSFMDLDARKVDELKISKIEYAVYSWCRDVVVKLAEELRKTQMIQE